MVAFKRIAVKSIALFPSAKSLTTEKYAIVARGIIAPAGVLKNLERVGVSQSIKSMPIKRSIASEIGDFLKENPVFAIAALIPWVGKPFEFKQAAGTYRDKKLLIKAVARNALQSSNSLMFVGNPNALRQADAQINKILELRGQKLRNIARVVTLGGRPHLLVAFNPKKVGVDLTRVKARLPTVIKFTQTATAKKPISAWRKAA